MEPGKTYDISAWVKIDGATADTIKMTVELVDTDDATPQYLTIAQSGDTLDWVKLSTRYTYAPVGTATTFKVYFEAGTPDSSYYIDNLVITEATEISPLQ
jgi:endo-1,4-beta-xylanase